MGAATSTNTSYGYRVTGDTGAVTVTTGPIRVRAFICIGNGDDDLFTVTDGSSGAVMIMNSPDSDTPMIVDFYGKKLEGLIATVDDAASVMLILVD